MALQSCSYNDTGAKARTDIGQQLQVSCCNNTTATWMDTSSDINPVAWHRSSPQIVLEQQVEQFLLRTTKRGKKFKCAIGLCPPSGWEETISWETLFSHNAFQKRLVDSTMLFNPIKVGWTWWWVCGPTCFALAHAGVAAAVAAMGWCPPLHTSPTTSPKAPWI